MTTTYVLMNKNRPLLSFYPKETISGFMELQEYKRYVESDLLPPSFSNINTWVTKRNHAKEKEHLQGWLHE